MRSLHTGSLETDAECSRRPTGPVALDSPVVPGIRAQLELASYPACAEPLTVRHDFLGRPRTRVPIHRIATARAIEIRPSDWGGWGYRGNFTLMNRAAVVLRAGSGLRLDVYDGKIFAIAIDTPETPAQLLNAEACRLDQSTRRS